ncbi:hypothetical protein CTI12_AA478070 [Artemisia annua]|uniref:C2H2-type domain-containing protein n=1 Tax=Artemisia annua TaxID=35608 RepID=A0A2U1L0R3_ARTAN|nr:hypothetical protein CTI12_AA478070 [Artemisia annua]
MKCNLKSNIGKNRDRLSESSNRNKTSILPECDPRRIDEPSLSNSIDVCSSSADASVFSCVNAYSGPVMLDFGLKTVHHLPCEYLGFNKAKDSITARELRLRDAGHTNEPAPSLPAFFSRQRLKRSNVTDKVTHKRRKKIESATEGSNMNDVNSVLQDCSQSTINTDDTDQINGRCFSPNTSQVTSVNVVRGYTQRARPHESGQTSINNTGLPLNSSPDNFTQSLYVNEKRKASPDMTARSLRQRLSGSRSAYGSNNNLSTSTSVSDFNNNFQSDDHHQASDTTKGVDSSDSPLLPLDQRTTGFSQPSGDAPVGLQHTEQQCDFHFTQGASINNGSSSQTTPTTYLPEPVCSSTRRKAPANLATRSVRRRLSTSSSQSSSFEHGSQQSNVHRSEDQSLLYEDLGDCNERCRYCNAAFWHGERLKGHRDATYHLCCGGGKVYIESEPEPPDYIRHLLSDATFMQHIRAYNQMFAMTSFGANIDNTVNQGRGPYVFKVSGQVYHQIGSLCPTGDDKPCFLQLYIYDTQNEVQNRMDHFTSSGTNPLNPQIVEGLIEFLDTHNELVQVFRTARDKCAENDVPEFKVRLYNGNSARGYELPTSQAIGAIVFDSGPTTESDYDIIIEYRDGPAKRINKLHQSYMSLQFPLIFVYGQPGYHIKLMTWSANPNERMRRQQPRVQLQQNRQPDPLKRRSRPEQ